MINQAKFGVFRLATVALVLGVAGAGQAHAQIKHIDYTSINQQVSPKAAASFYMDPSSISSQMDPQMQRFVGKAPNMDKFMAITHANLPKGNMTMNNSPMSGQMDNSPLFQKTFSTPGNLTEKSYRQTSTRNPDMNSAMQKYSSLNDFAQDSQFKQHTTGPSKYTDSYVFHTIDNTPMQQVGKELSLQDFNRYQFQGEHSGTPGISSTHAGNAGQPTVSGLTNGPATFDNSAFQSGRVITGTSDQFRVVTPNGSHPYQPLQLGASSQKDNAPNSNFSLSSDASASPKSNGYETVYSQAKVSQQPRVDNAGPVGATFMPTGNYAPTTPSGNQIPMSFDAPKMIIQVKKGGFVKLDDGKTDTASAQ